MNRAAFALLALVPLVLAVPALPAAGKTEDGANLFRQTCGGCHLAGGFGTRVLARRVPAGQAELEKRRDLAADYVKAVVRHGMGSMPQIRRTELPDAQLNTIAAYLENGQ